MMKSVVLDMVNVSARENEEEAEKKQVPISKSRPAYDVTLIDKIPPRVKNYFWLIFQIQSFF